MIITFIGHSTVHCDSDLLEKIRKCIYDNISCEEQTVFYCGGYGAFDSLCATACHLIKEKNPNCEIIYVTPYMTESHQKKMKAMIEDFRYDGIVYPPLENVPLRYAISRRNEWMVNQADLIIAYVLHGYGGAYNALKYARKKKKRIVNLAE